LRTEKLFWSAAAAGRVDFWAEWPTRGWVEGSLARIRCCERPLQVEIDYLVTMVTLLESGRVGTDVKW